MDTIVDDSWNQHEGNPAPFKHDIRPDEKLAITTESRDINLGESIQEMQTLARDPIFKPD
jgi:hypothetical protein